MDTLSWMPFELKLNLSRTEINPSVDFTAFTSREVSRTSVSFPSITPKQTPSSTTTQPDRNLHLSPRQPSNDKLAKVIRILGSSFWFLTTVWLVRGM